ncbi:MAG: hypothetical protein ACO2PN_28785 [Pyrobaculum sp.]
MFFLRSWLRGVRWRRRFWRLWNVRRAAKWCRRRSMLFFVVGFLVGFVGPLAGVGGGALFTPLAVGLLGVDVKLARTGGSSWRRLLWLGLSRRRLLRLMRGRLSRWARFWGLWRWGWGFSWRLLSCWVEGRSGLRGASTGSPSGLGLWRSFGRSRW